LPATRLSADDSFAMPNFAAPVPIETEKSGAYLHDRASMPASPSFSVMGWVKENQGFVLGLIFALGFSALAFQTRSTWHTHRDWVIPVTTPLLAIGGVCLGHLVGRRAIKALMPGLGMVALAIVLTGFNILRSVYSHGPDTARNILTVLTAIAIAAAIALCVLATVQLELRNPTKAPKPEM
jgi:asparagine N-glycosylation enzyme membrane subunit Stt3